MGWGTRSVVLVAAAIAGCGRVGFDTTGQDGAPVPVVGFAFASSLTDEAAGTHHVNLTLSAATTSDVTVDVQVDGGTATEGPDFALDKSQVTIPAGSTQGSVDLVIVNDGLAEPDETIDLRLGNAVNARLGAADHTVTISNQVLPRVEFSLTTASAPEDSGAVGIVVQLDMVAATDVVFEYSVGGTATPNEDHQFVADTVTIDAGFLGNTASGGIIDDLLDEDDETVILTLNALSGAVLGANTTCTVTIVDQDPPPSAAFEVTSSSNPEPNGDVGILVRLSAPSGKTVTVQYAVTGGTATDPEDYHLALDTLTFPPGTTGKAITPVPVNDALDENDETAIISLTSATNATLGTMSTHTWTILDDDLPPHLSFTVVAVAVNEDVGTYTAGVSLDAPSGLPVSFAITSATGTASAMDFNVGTGPYMIPPGSTSTSVPVTIVQDGIVEMTETFTLGLSGPINATVGAVGTQTVSILDDDGAGLQVRFNPAESDDAAAEGNGTGSSTYTYQVVLSAASGSPITVDFTVGGTAGATDRVITAPPVTFNPGVTTQMITLQVVHDAALEPDETVVMTLISATGGVTIATPSTRTHTIVNDD